MADNSETNVIKLRSSDGQVIEATRDAANMSGFLNGLDDEAGKVPVPVLQVTANTLTKILEYCEYHCRAGQQNTPEAEMKAWDENFIAVDDAMLFDLMLAANYLDIKGLLHLTCRRIADAIRGNTPDELRARFNITN
uniref:SKP1-like protein n=1 Tax=Chrysotila carterae TaxID=13221 RepID=A0A6T0CPQ5_CHRCT